MTRRASVLVAPLLVYALGCPAAANDLFVDLKTDYVGSIEFDRVETTLELADGTARTVAYDPTGEEDFAAGARIAEIAGLPSGEHRLRVRLLGLPSEIVDEETILLSVQRSFGVVAVLTRSCARVECPGPDDPEMFRQCLGGRCVDERCSDVTPELCGPPTCAADADCVPSAPCATGVCDPARGFCTFPPIDGACHETDWCSPESGCQVRPDLFPDGLASCEELESAFFDACSLPPPTSGMIIAEPGEHVFDTDAEELRPPGGGAAVSWPGTEVNGALVVSVQTFKVLFVPTLRVVGRRPLAIAALGPVEVDGTIDLSSRVGDAGAGANAPHCADHSAVAGTDDPMAASGGGGGGGGYGGTGGDGGDGSDPSVPRRAGGAGGAPYTPPAGLVAGGCAGGRGGNGSSAGGAAGPGGGGLLLSSAYGVIVEGTIHAGGAGGANGPVDDDGAGGGGSGGLIALEAPILILGATSVCAANGGGGGHGAGPGTDAEDGQPSSRAAVGGTSAIGSGGAGSAATMLEGARGADGGEGGGGGGGGAGHVLLVGPVRNVRPGAVASPPATVR